MRFTTPTRRHRTITRAALVAGAALTLTATGFLGASAANAATGTTGSTGQGARNVTVYPTSPATSFAPIGTTGTLRFDTWDGTTTSGSYSVTKGERATFTVGVPAGLKFGASACSNYKSPYWTCSVSADGRVLTTIYTAQSSFTAANITSSKLAYLPVVSTGVIDGKAIAGYVDYTGLRSKAPSATSANITNKPAAPTVTGQTSTTISGKGTPGATVTVTDANGNKTTTTVGSNGTYTASTPAGATYPLKVTQTVNGITSDPVTVNSAPTPVADPAIAGGTAAVLAGLGTLLWRRRRHA